MTLRLEVQQQIQDVWDRLRVDGVRESDLFIAEALTAAAMGVIAGWCDEQNSISGSARYAWDLVAEACRGEET